MEDFEHSRKTLVKQAAKLLALGYEVEYRRSIVKRIADMGIEPSMELFRAIDEFNTVKMKFEKLEIEHLALKAKIERQIT